MHIVVIAGGSSSERDVSLRSGAAVQAALIQAGHQATIHDPAEQPIDDALGKYDVAFPIIHGQGGEDGSLQQQLEAIGLAYVGSGVDACRLTFNKSTYKELLNSQGIPTPAGSLIRVDNLHNNPLVQTPFVLKPYDGGSSVDTFIVRDQAAAPWQRIEQALTDTYHEMLLESLIEGIEITVGVVGEQALPVIEIIPPSGGEFDYENKYNGASQELCPPQHVAAEVQQQAQQLALQIHQLCDCQDFSRTDMIVSSDGKLIVLETNTLPGMTNESLLPKAAGVAGMAMPALCDRLVQLAVSRQTGAA